MKSLLGVFGGWLALGLLGVPGVHAQDAKAAETFVRTLYAHYGTQKDFSAFADARSTQAIATPSRAALFERELAASRTAREESEIDYDPVAGGQDNEGLQLVGLQVELTKPGQAVAAATVRVAQDAPHTRRLRLAAVKGEWRIDDITNGKGQEGLRENLTRAIALHRTARRH